MTRILQTMMANFLGQKAAIRPQKTSLKAIAAKTPHFAHGCSRILETQITQFENFWLASLVLIMLMQPPQNLYTWQYLICTF